MAGVDVENLASARVLQKVGFVGNPEFSAKQFDNYTLDMK